jgi:uncharacterized protein (TIGR03437 family)
MLQHLRPFLAPRSLRWLGLSFLLLAIGSSFLFSPVNKSFALQTSGFEGDVTPRPGGKNGAIKATDFVQVGRFAMGLETASVGSEWQRADVAPRATLGDGRIGIADVVQTMRYAAELDPLTVAGGPTAAPGNPALAGITPRAEAVSEVRVGTPTFGAGTMTVPMELVAMGTENALGFSLAYDPGKLSNPVVVLGTDATDALLLLNTNQLANGRLGVGLALPAGKQYAAGVRQILRITFDVSAASLGTQTPLGFGNSPVPLEMADVQANALVQTIFTGAQLIVNFPAPTLSALNPATALTGDAGFTLGVTGGNFVNGAVVRWGNTNLVTTFQSATLLTATVPAALIASAGMASITVVNPSPGGGASNALGFAINNAVPTLGSLGFTTIAAGSAGGTLAVNGNGFVPGSIVFWNGRPCPTRFISRTQLIVDYAAADIACAGIIRVTIVSPAPGGGTSIAQTFSIAPTLTSLNPTSTFVGSNDFTLTALGTGFCEGARVRVNGIARTSSVVSQTQITTTITAADVASAGSLQISIVTADGVVSNNLSLAINNRPAPTITSLNPATILNGSPAFTLTVNGTGFFPESRVHWNGADRRTTFVSRTQLTAAISAADVALAGMAQVTVNTPAPGGGTSAPVNFAITGLEADVATRPTGNGSLTTADWVQLGRFYVESDTPAPGSEFQRADCFPVNTKGDGRITIGDWVQAGRYAAGFDAPVTVGGPTARLFMPSLATPANLMTAAGNEAATRIMRARDALMQRGQLGIVQIELDGQGTENALAFSLNFDPQRMSFLDATLGDGAQGAALQLNRTQTANGRIGLAVVMPPGQELSAGKRTMLTLRFIPNGGDSDVVTNLSFGDQVLPREVVNAFAAPVSQVNYVNAAITIRGRAAATVSAASYADAELAADSIASAFGTNLATVTDGAASLPLPASLGGTSVKVKDAAGVERIAPLFFVSPNQINYLIPAGTADGIASVTITNGAGEVTSGLLSIGNVAPGLFTAEASGQGFAAADVVYVAADGSQTLSSVTRFDAAQNKRVGLPIDLSYEAAVLVLYGTGIRQRSDVSAVRVRIDGVDAPLDYAGQQGGYFGLDQVNVRLPRNLSGRGVVTVELRIDEKVANPVQIQIK